MTGKWKKSRSPLEKVSPGAGLIYIFDPDYKTCTLTGHFENPDDKERTWLVEDLHSGYRIPRNWLIM